MWLDNVPRDATHEELCLKVTGDGVTSILLISRSNCTFVNFNTEGSLHGHQLCPQDRRGPRLVRRACRREDDLRAGVEGQCGMGVHMEYSARKVKGPLSSSMDDDKSIASDVSGISIQSQVSPMPSDDDAANEQSSTVKACAVSSCASTNANFLARRVPRRVFILKSLTRFYSLELSAERGLWATQKHSKVILGQ
ncbi:hypothetical protein PISMIDRAFT_31031 [Pisolithus microcarpus 441]|uniref:Uncharacterized protein n=1 Tax=Pisolithus microcarpus 441 TaxID=765257 RepID=A0A0C9YF45_9AGAM|nr:hypothetical protein BKA83DRAFT_31031 [Pisolithus microcarpus]KIK15251.1 hypothetical protein PISMIDRAFT_31031 [Pisolithus microcarpus 441]